MSLVYESEHSDREEFEKKLIQLFGQENLSASTRTDLGHELYLYYYAMQSGDIRQVAIYNEDTTDGSISGGFEHLYLMPIEQLR